MLSIIGTMLILALLAFILGVLKGMTNNPNTLENKTNIQEDEDIHTPTNEKSDIPFSQQ